MEVFYHNNHIYWCSTIWTWTLYSTSCFKAVMTLGDIFFLWCFLCLDVWNYFHNNHIKWFYPYGHANGGVSLFVMLLLLRCRKTILTIMTLGDLFFAMLLMLKCCEIIFTIITMDDFMHMDLQIKVSHFLCCFCCLEVVNLFAQWSHCVI